MKFERIFFLKSLSDNFLTTKVFLFFKIRHSSSNKWVETREFFSLRGSRLLTLKKSEFLRLLNFNFKSLLNDLSNLCFFSLEDFFFVYTNQLLLKNSILRTFLVKVNTQALFFKSLTDIFNVGESLKFFYLNKMFFLNKKLFLLLTKTTFYFLLKFSFFLNFLKN